MLCDHLEGWGREGWSETQEGRDMGKVQSRRGQEKTVVKQKILVFYRPGFVVQFYYILWKYITLNQLSKLSKTNFLH